MSFDTVSLQLVDWANEILSDIPITLSVPTQTPKTEFPQVSLYLFELRDSTMLSTNNQDSYQILLRYLVTAWGAKEKESHELLGKLFIAGSKSDFFDISLELQPYEFWSSLTLPPTPSFIIEILYTEPKELEQPKLVEKDLIIETHLVDSKIQKGE